LGGRRHAAVFELLGNTLDEIVIAAVEQMPISRAMLRDFALRIAVHTGIDANVECADRWNGDDCAFAPMFAAVSEAFLIARVIDALHLGGV
jgi:hypothetical protein